MVSVITQTSICNKIHQVIIANQYQGYIQNDAKNADTVLQNSNTFPFEFSAIRKNKGGENTTWNFEEQHSV